MAWSLLVLCAVGLLLLWRTPHCPHPGEQGEPSDISVIIPARNEAQNLPRLLKSLQTQRPLPREIIVVDDDSTDGTADIARSGGARVIQAPTLPDGWRGKTWACHNGAGAATSATLLFLDADTVLRPNALSRMQAACSKPCRVLSLGPYHEVQRPYEQFSAIFNILTFMGMGAFGLSGAASHPRGLFGPVLMIDRNAYRQVGGHAAVRSEILEHMSLAHLLNEEHIPMQCLNGRGVVHIRMYPDGFRSMVEGWTKAFATGAAKTSSIILTLTILWMIGGILATAEVLLIPFLPHPHIMHTIPYLAYAASIYSMLRRIGSFRWWAAALYPALLVVFFTIFTRSALRRMRGGTVTWKGRSISTVKNGAIP